MRIFGRSVTILRPRPVEPPEVVARRERQARAQAAAEARDRREREAQARAALRRVEEDRQARAEAEQREQAAAEWREAIKRSGVAWFPGDHIGPLEDRPARRGVARRLGGLFGV
jgi:hypothetical protein